MGAQAEHRGSGQGVQGLDLRRQGWAAARVLPAGAPWGSCSHPQGEGPQAEDPPGSLAARRLPDCRTSGELPGEVRLRQDGEDLSPGELSWIPGSVDAK